MTSPKNLCYESLPSYIIEQFLIELTKLKEESYSNTGISRKNFDMIIFDMIINVLNKNVYKRLTLNDIAKICNLSESNLKKTFRMYADSGVMTYFNHLKALEAKKLLRQGVQIGTISQMLSFYGQDYFCVFF